MPKRSATSSSDFSDSEAARSSPRIELDSDDDVKPSPSKKSKSKPAKAVKKKDDSKDRQTPRSWTTDEDAIFIAIATEQLKKTMWQAIKDDGRLEHRGGPGVRAHLIAMMNKVKKDIGA